MVRDLQYTSGISLEEATKRIEEVIDEFQKVKKHYTGLRGLVPLISKKDRKVLQDCIGVLLPLGLERCVQEEARNNPTYQSLIHKEITETNYHILFYLARFKNTGIKAIWYP
mgnify:CR=1 FL=1